MPINDIGKFVNGIVENGPDKTSAHVSDPHNGVISVNLIHVRYVVSIVPKAANAGIHIFNLSLFEILGAWSELLQNKITFFGLCSLVLPSLPYLKQ